MMEIVKMIERRYERGVPYGKKGNDGKLRRSDKRLTRIERNWRGLVCIHMHITVNGTTRAADVCLQKLHSKLCVKIG